MHVVVKQVKLCFCKKCVTNSYFMIHVLWHWMFKFTLHISIATKIYPIATIHGCCVWIRNITTQQSDTYWVVIRLKGQKLCPKVQYVNNTWLYYTAPHVSCIECIHGREISKDCSVRSYPPVRNLMYLHYMDIFAGYKCLSNLHRQSVNCLHTVN